MAEDDLDPDLIDDLLRWQRGLGPRPEVPADDDELAALLAAVADSAEMPAPPIETDPVAVRLGLADSHDDRVAISLRELAARLGGELDIEEVPAAASWAGAEDGWRVRAVARTLAERVVVAETAGDDLAPGLAPAAVVFTRQPETTAVALVSSATHLAVVVTEADCVTAIDPRTGWADPALPREPEPFPLALGRHLERTRPRWDEIAHLDDMLVFAPDPDRTVTTIGRVVAEGLGRPVRLPARRAALAALGDLDAAAVADVVEHVRTGALAGDDLLDRIRALAGAGAT